MFVYFFKTFGLSDYFFYCALLLIVIPMKQLSGFPWWRSILNVLLSFLATYYMLFWGIHWSASIYATIMLL